MNLLDPNKQPVDELRAMLFQPAADIPQRLALRLGLQVNGPQFSGPPGERVVFGASKALKHDLSGDHPAVTFAAQNELLDHWIAAIILELDRGWTQDGLQDRSFTRGTKCYGPSSCFQSPRSSPHRNWNWLA